MFRVLALLLVLGALPFTGSAAAAASPPPCDLADASPWIRRWLAAWEFTSREILRLPDAPAPGLVFYDSACVYTTSNVAAGGMPPGAGPALHGTPLPWRTFPHGDTLTLPDTSRIAVQLLSFANSDRQSGPFFVMAAPSYWARRGHGQEPGLTGVFLHEFAHTRQIPGMARILGPIDSTWSLEPELDDDVVQTHFESDSAYVAAYRAERDLMFRAAEAESLTEVRALAGQALEMIQRRHERWFTGERAVFATLDDLFLSFEGAGQWAAQAWLAHPAGGGMSRKAAVEKMLGRRRRWSQDEGLGLFLVVDRLLPGWPALVFGEPSMGAVELLRRAVGR